jgi:hypothetical protein
VTQKRTLLGTAVVVSYAAVGGWLSATGAIASLWLSDVREPCTEYAPPIDRETWYSCTLDHPGGLAPEVADAYERGWVVMILILLAVPMLALAFRLTRVRLTRVRAGRPEQDRLEEGRPEEDRPEEDRLEQGRESRGDRPGTLRVAFVGVAAAPLGYGALWLWLSGSVPEGARFLPESVWPGLVVWPVVAIALGGLAAAAVIRVPERSPERDLWGWHRRRRSQTTGMVRLALRFAFAVGVLAVVVRVTISHTFFYPILLWFLVLSGIGVVWTLGEPVLALTGRFLVWSNLRAGGAGRRLTALAPRATGVAGILLVFGVALSVLGRWQASVRFGPSTVGTVVLLEIGSLLAVLPSLLLLGLVVAQETTDRRARRKQLVLVLYSTLSAGYLIGLLVPGNDGWSWKPLTLVASVALPAVVGVFATALVPLLARMPAPGPVGDVSTGADEGRGEEAMGGGAGGGEGPGGQSLDWFLNG